ncbi:AGE family epimerase/isomerase [Isoptericola jiangsuensis]|uniref:AGE family epimerase/isomerase n=1 Tax=Isoptericola jiangsuensis TaxID=548579 RepID=UPI003AB0A1BE
MSSDGALTSFPGVRTAAQRREHFRSLVDVAGRSLRQDGAACWLDDDLEPLLDRRVDTWITARMAHVLGLGAILGVSGAAEGARSTIGALADILHDGTYGGWFASVGTPDEDGDATKQAYAHAFVVLAASTGVQAGVDGSRELLDSALTCLDRRFWESRAGLHADECSRDWSTIAPYRGVNANMHAVEALLAAFDATGDTECIARAVAIADRVVGWAAQNSWRIPEHFDTGWNVLLDFNADHPRDPFKPFGATPGHGLEWARLLLQLDVAGGTPSHRTAAAVALYDRAAADGWDPAGGFVYTTDWSGAAVEARRFHWVAAEAVAAADVLGRVTGEQRYEDDAARWWEWIDDHLVDHEGGSWFHELDVDNRPSGRTWIGKPDVYHAAQAVILPELPLAGSFAGGARTIGQLFALGGDVTG